ncbi:MAG: glucokinase [Myxococcales bacterium]|nr:glucokinase [Myxococcales bacterium]
MGAGELLCGDVGGTKCLLGLVDAAGVPHAVMSFPSARFARFEELCRAYLDGLDGRHEPPDAACFAVAGPVDGDFCATTNLPWQLDARALAAELGLAQVRLVNDFHAQALAVLALPPADLVEIVPGRAVAGGPIAVLGAGTGLGEALLVQHGGRYEVIATEGGHKDFAPTSELQLELYRALRAQLGGRVSVERVLSGAGLAAIYRFLVERGTAPESDAVRAGMAVEDPAAVVSRHALAGDDALCVAAFALFVEVYAQEAGNLALQLLARGGVYLAGGIAAKNLPRFQDGAFARAFHDKGRMRPLVERIPVHVVTNPASGLVGAAVAGRRGE